MKQNCHPFGAAPMNHSRKSSLEHHQGPKNHKRTPGVPLHGQYYVIDGVHANRGCGMRLLQMAVLLFRFLCVSVRFSCQNGMQTSPIPRRIAQQCTNSALMQDPI